VSVQVGAKRGAGLAGIRSFSIKPTEAELVERSAIQRDTSLWGGP
jgi:hypothetical protein